MHIFQTGVGQELHLDRLANRPLGQPYAVGAIGDDAGGRRPIRIVVFRQPEADRHRPPSVFLVRFRCLSGQRVRQ